MPPCNGSRMRWRQRGRYSGGSAMHHPCRSCPLAGAAAICIILVCVAPQSVSAQSAAQLSGQIRDPVGAVVTGVSVTVIHLDSGLLRNAASGDDGWYAVSSLPEGEYKITARKPG